MFAGRVQDDSQATRSREHFAPAPRGRSPAAELGRVQCAAVEILGTTTPSSVFVHEVVRKDTESQERGGGVRDVTTVISWLGGGCGGHRWVLGKPAAQVSVPDLRAVLGQQSGGCRHG
jgi:hypothetical protein